MSSAVEEYVLYQIANAPMREYPYAHIYVENVFPDDFYAALRANWPDPSALISLADTGRVPKGAYPERFVLPFTPAGIDKLTPDRRAFWTEFASWLHTERFLTAMIDKFELYVKQRFGDLFHHRYSFEVDALVVRDLTNYSIGPHTDAPHRLLSMLFYCPDDDTRKHLGTSIYVPRDPAFRCQGGPHYPHQQFQKVKTMEYKPNSLFAFIKNDHSFHGVEAIGDQNVQRDVMLYDIRAIEPKHEPLTQTAGVGIRMLKRLFGGNQE
jgi:hypothetical protein